MTLVESYSRIILLKHPVESRARGDSETHIGCGLIILTPLVFLETAILAIS